MQAFHGALALGPPAGCRAPVLAAPALAGRHTPRPTPQRRRATWLRAAPKDRLPSAPGLDSSLDALDALLSQDEDGTEPGSAAQQQQQQRRTARRRTAMGSDPHSTGRSVLDEFTRGSSSLLAVGAQTEVGADNAQLPEAEPLFAPLFAAWVALASTGVFLLPEVFDPERWVMYSDLEALEGTLGTFLAANFVSATWPALAVGMGLLATAGRAAERVLGRGRFASTFLLSGATGLLGYYALSTVGNVEAYHCGPSMGIMGVGASLLATVAKNRKVLSGRQQLQLAGTALAGGAVAVAADAFLWLDHTFIAGAYVAAALAGAGLGAAGAPQYLVLREYLVPDGSVEVPEDAPEVQVVVDKTSGLQQWAPVVAYSLFLALFAWVVTGLPPELLEEFGLFGGLEEGLDEEFLEQFFGWLLRGGPEAARELYDVAPEEWPLKA